MFNVRDILNTAYRYTKNHKPLWFFGFFLTSWGGLSFIRRIDLDQDRLTRNFNVAKDYVFDDPVRAIIFLLSSLLVLLLMFFAGAIARAVVIRSALKVKEQGFFRLKEVIAEGKSSFAKIFVLGISLNAIMFLILVLLLAPLYISLSKGMLNQTIILGIAAAAIYLPVVIVISLVNIFASCFITVYSMSPVKAVRAAFDLLSSCIEKVVALFFVLIVLYAISFLLSFLLFSTVSGFTYFLGFNLKTLAISSFFGIIVAALVLLSLVMLLVNAILNVFTNICWTLFFVEIVREGNGSEQKRLLAQDMGG